MVLNHTQDWTGLKTKQSAPQWGLVTCQTMTKTTAQALLCTRLWHRVTANSAEPSDRTPQSVLITGGSGCHFASRYSTWTPNHCCSWPSPEASEGAPRSTRETVLAALASILKRHARHAQSFRGTASSIRQSVHMKSCVFSMCLLHKLSL